MGGASEGEISTKNSLSLMLCLSAFQTPCFVLGLSGHCQSLMLTYFLAEAVKTQLSVGLSQCFATA